MFELLTKFIALLAGHLITIVLIEKNLRVAMPFYTFIRMIDPQPLGQSLQLILDLTPRMVIFIMP